MTSSIVETFSSCDSGVKENIQLLSRYCYELKLAVNKLDELVTVIRAKMKLMHDYGSESEFESEPEPARHGPVRSLQNVPEQLEPIQNVLEAQAPQIEPPTAVTDGEQAHMLDNTIYNMLNVTEVVPNLEVSVPTIEPMETVPETAIQQVDVTKRGSMAAGEEPVDITLLPTQVLQPLSQGSKRGSQQDRASKRSRPSGILSFRESILAEYEATAEKENIPPGSMPAPTPRLTVSEILQEAGLADIQPLRPAVEQALTRELDSQVVVQRQRPSDESGTPLGSIDRTKVSLGDSVRTTDTQRFIRNHWGIEGTMVKILGLVRAKAGPVTVHSLVARGPILHAARGIIAARCFSSVLKLKQHGFIKMIKDPETLDIRDITLGPQFDDIQ